MDSISAVAVVEHPCVTYKADERIGCPVRHLSADESVEDGGLFANHSGSEEGTQVVTGATDVVYPDGPRTSARRKASARVNELDEVAEVSARGLHESLSNRGRKEVVGIATRKDGKEEGVVRWDDGVQRAEDVPRREVRERLAPVQEQQVIGRGEHEPDANPTERGEVTLDGGDVVTRGEYPVEGVEKDDRASRSERRDDQAQVVEVRRLGRGQGVEHCIDLALRSLLHARCGLLTSQRERG